MRQSPGRHSRTPGRKEEEGQCAKRGCSEPSMVPKALIFCMCLTGCLSSQGAREGLAQPAVAGGSAGEEEVERGGGQPAPRRTRHRRARQAPPAGVRGVVLISCGGSGSRNPPRPSRAASPCPGHRPTPSPDRPEPRLASPAFRFRRVRALFRAPRGRAHAALLGRPDSLALGCHPHRTDGDRRA